MDKKSFVLTGYVQRNTCNCGCITSNCFFQDGGFGGSIHLASLHRGIEEYLDELSGAGPGKNGESCDVKVTITIEKLGPHDHQILNRHSFSGLGMGDHEELKDQITEPAVPEDVVELKGEEEFRKSKSLNRTLPVPYIQDIHDRLLLLQRTGNMSKLGELLDSLQSIIRRED